jgi:site-specific recombinase XerD
MKNKVVLDECLAYKRQICQQSTIKEMRSALKKYFLYLPEEDSLEISAKERRIHLDKMAQSLSPPYFARTVRQVKDFYAYCTLYGLAKNNPFERFNPQFYYEPSLDILFEPELMAFFDCIDHDNRLSFPKRFLLELFIATMGQVKEILNFKVHRVLFDEGRLFFHLHGNQYLMSNSWIQEHREDYLQYRDHRMFEGNERHMFVLVNDVRMDGDKSPRRNRQKKLKVYLLMNLY